MIQIRQNVFETNSSSTHSISICTDNDYQRWANGEGIYYVQRWPYWWLSGTKKELCEPLVHDDHPFYTREEVTKILDLGYGDNFNDLNEWDLCFNYGILTYEQFITGELECYEYKFTTPSGDKMVAFGQYGYDG